MKENQERPSFSFKTFELKFNSGWKKITFTFNPKFCHFIVMEYTCKKSYLIKMYETGFFWLKCNAPA